MSCNGFVDGLINLKNNTKDCIKYEWMDLQIDGYLKVEVEPQRGSLKSGLTKLFKIRIKSFENHLLFENLCLKCLIPKYEQQQVNCKQFNLPHYFEYTITKDIMKR